MTSCGCACASRLDREWRTLCGNSDRHNFDARVTRLTESKSRDCLVEIHWQDLLVEACVMAGAIS